MENNEIHKYIFWKSKNKIGISSWEEWSKHSKEHNINPIVISILECSDKYIDELMDLFSSNPNEFVKEVQKQISDDIYAIFMD